METWYTKRTRVTPYSTQPVRYFIRTIHRKRSPLRSSAEHSTMPSLFFLSSRPCFFFSKRACAILFRPLKAGSPSPGLLLQVGSLREHLFFLDITNRLLHKSASSFFTFINTVSPLLELREFSFFCPAVDRRSRFQPYTFPFDFHGPKCRPASPFGFELHLYLYKVITFPFVALHHL